MKIYSNNTDNLFNIVKLKIVDKKIHFIWHCGHWTCTDLAQRLSAMERLVLCFIKCVVTCKLVNYYYILFWVSAICDLCNSVPLFNFKNLKMGRPTTSIIRNYYEYDRVNNESKCKICSAKLKVSTYYTFIIYLPIHLPNIISYYVIYII